MNKIKILMPLACFGLLVSCNKDMPTISDEAAKKIASDMVTRHSDSSLFMVPENYMIKSNYSNSKDQKKYDGTKKETSTGKTERYFDYKNLRLKQIETTSNNTSSSSKTMYIFYDNVKGVRVETHNDNGLKYRYEFSSSFPLAQSYFANTLRGQDLPSIRGDNLLTSFSSTIDNYKTYHEKYKNESDQHFNYSVGSSNAKSLQLKTDSKLKKELIDSDIKFTGYEESKDKITINVDKVTNNWQEYKTSYKSENNLFYINEIRKSNVEYSYGGVSIDIPNINEYELKS